MLSMKHTLALVLMVFGSFGVSAKQLPLCKDTLLYWVNYFDDCRTIRYESNGFAYTGNWKKNKHHDRMAFLRYLKTGAVNNGQFIDGKKHGIWWTTFADNSNMISEFNMGELNMDTIKSFAKPDAQPNTTYSQPVPSTGSNQSIGSFLAEMGTSLLGGNKPSSSSSTRSKAATPSYPTYTSSLTVPSNQLCPLLASPVVKQEVVRGNRICYYQ